MDQFNNPDNWRAHFRTTADEIYEAVGEDLRMVVATMGTTGTVMGITRRMRDLDLKVRVIGVEPFKGHKIQGLKNMKESYPPGIFDPTVPDAIVNVDDDSAYEMSRRLAKEEGIFVGMSSGAALKVAVDQAAELDGGVVVAILPDTGERYLSTPLFTSEKVPIPLRFFEHPQPPGGGSGAHQPGPGGHVRLRAQPGRAARSGSVPAHGLHRSGAALSGVPGFEVKLVINLADIDDRTVNQCLKEGAKLEQFAARWEKAFFDDMKMLNIKPADHYPKASEHVTDMIEQTRRLVEKGLAYEKLKSVYYNISKFEGYGKLSGMDLATIQTGGTIDYDYYEKENPADFTLVKRSSLAELKAGVYWQTRWGNVRPGWHVECATMATDHLGQPFDIHMASTDLIFPHGDNEIAVAEGLTGKPLANMWLHSEVVMAGGAQGGPGPTGRTSPCAMSWPRATARPRCATGFCPSTSIGCSPTAPATCPWPKRAWSG